MGNMTCFLLFNFSFSVNITDAAVTKLQFSSEGIKMRKVNSTIQKLMEYLFGYSVQGKE